MYLSLFPISSDLDILAACEQGQSLATAIGFRGADLALIATAVSEIARNIVEHAKEGEIGFGEMNEPGRRGILVVARERGDGMADLEKVMLDRCATGNDFGAGLTGTRRLMDDFKIISRAGRGTVVTMQKWLAS